MTGMKEMALVEAEPQALSLIAMIDRAARDPTVDMEKMDRLMQMYERTTARQAREAFNMAMSEAQKAMRPIAADADNPQTRSRYASYMALDKALRPIYTDHGFGLSFNTTDGAPEGYIRVVCDVTHNGGHEKPYRIDMPADGKGAKGGDVMTKTHATGAAMSYGMRYLLKMIWNVAVGEDDRDGNTVDQRTVTDPVGFDQWMADFQAAADNGMDVLTAAWKQSNPKFRDHAQKHYRGKVDAAKVKAGKVVA